MSSIKGVIPPSIAKKKEEQGIIPKGINPKGVNPKGVVPRKSSVVKKLPQEIRDDYAKAPSSLLVPLPQPFHGVAPSIVMSQEEKKEAIEQAANPLLHPDQRLLKKKKKKEQSAKQPIVSASKASSVAETNLRLVKKTEDMSSHDRSDVLTTDQEIELDEIDPLFLGYRDEQDKIESANPYQLDEEIYTPITRRSYYKFIHDTYSERFKILPKPKGPIDENACEKIEASKREGAVEAFSYQRFISEYLRLSSPYRGLLVYHGLGSGKTCSAIAAAEALYGVGNKRIIVMTPFSLRPNFMSEISFCGFRHYNVNNHWVAQSLASPTGSVYVYAREVLSLSEKYLKRIFQRTEDRQVIWIPDFTKPSNFYDDSQLTSQNREDIRDQITNMIDSRITFISYNGITSRKLKEYACNDLKDLENEDEDSDVNDDDEGRRVKFFDNAVIVIDEVHNLIRLMQGNIVPYITKRSGRARKIKEEPIVPGRWKPGLCDKPENYKRAYLFYRLLTDARNSKIIGLSGTPIINFPEELGILANVLAGYMECVEFDVATTDEDDLEEIKGVIEENPRVDIVRYQKSDRKTEFLISLFNEGYVRDDNGKTKDGVSYVGVRYTDDEEGQETIQEVYANLKEEITGISEISAERFVSYPRLPMDDEGFRKEFINPVDLTIQNKLVLQKRITGLISYYATSNEALMPRVAKDEFVRCEMSDYTLNLYVQARKEEIQGEMNKKKESGDIFAAVEMFAKMKNPSSYRFRSRALCNFTFPEAIPRPFPGDEEVVDEVAMDENADLMEYSADPEADLQAMEEASMEEELAVEPEEVVDPEAPSVSSVSAPSAPSAPSISSVSAPALEGGAEEEEVPKIVPVKKGITAAQRAKLDALRAAKAAAALPAALPASSADSDAPLPVIPLLEEAAPIRPIVKIKKPAAAPVAASVAAVATDVAPLATDVAPLATDVAPLATDVAPLVSIPSDESVLEEAKPIRPIVKIKKPGSAPVAPVATVAVAPVAAVAADPAPIAPVAADVSPLAPLVSIPSDEIVLEEAKPIRPIVKIKKPGSAPVAAAPLAPLAPTIPITEPAPIKKSIKKPEVEQPAIKKSIKKPEVEQPVPIKKSIKKPEVEVEVEEEQEQQEQQAYVAPRMVIPYKDLVKYAMQELDEKRATFLTLDAVKEDGRLATYSNKLDRMLRNILASKGSNLVYSQFKTVEGLGVLGIALKANGFSEIVVQGSDADPYLSPATIESLRKGPQAGEKRFISFTGEGSKERRGLILNIFNGNIEKLPPKIQSVFTQGGYTEQKNIRGAICWVIGITGAGAEGISLRCCRSVHIMESYWNNVRLDQVKGRAIRICSHTDLPYTEREVEIYTYCSVFSEEQKRSKLDITIKTSDNNESSDEHVYNVSIKKDKINQGILTVMKEAAVDCGLNSADLGDIQCLRIEGRPDQYLFDPNLEVDKRITGIEFKQVIERKAFQEEDKSAAAIEKSLAQPGKSVSRVPKMRVKTFQLDGKQYYLMPYPKDIYKFKVYSPLDETFTKQLGELELDPITERPSRFYLYPVM